MKTRYLWVMTMTVVALTGCQKERVNSNLELIAEGMNGNTKLAVSGLQSYWVDGESVRINGNNYAITASIGEGGRAYVNQDVTVTSPYCGVYPADIYSGNVNASYTLDLPATYTYATTEINGNTVQNLASPMVAYATGNATALYFKHVTAAIGVQVVNYYGFTIAVDSIVVSSDNYRLHGEVTVDLTDDQLGLIPQSGSTTAEKRVKMLFSGASLHVIAGETATVQLPVLPVGDDNHYSIKVCVHKVDQPAVVKTLENTQTTGGALARAKIGFARFTTPGLFSVAADKQVIISQGNLQYIGSASTPYWQFAIHQYDFLGDNGQLTEGEKKDRDLFCWGTSGWNNGNYLYQPYSLPSSYPDTKGYGFGPTDGSRYDYDLTGTYANSDWGVYNKIQNGGNVSGWWRTMTGNTGGEWDYLVNTRNVSSRYVQATVEGVPGIILLPDDYSHPEGVDEFAQINSSNNYWSSNGFTVEKWVKIESEGAVFIPRAGYIEGTNYKTDKAYYWTPTHISSSSAYVFYFGSYSVSPTSDRAKKNRYPVRLVHDIE